MTNSQEDDRQSLEKKIKQLEQSNEIMQQLLKAIPHEYRAPITMITGFASLLLAEKTLNEKQREFVERIVTIAERLQHINRDMLDIASTLSSGENPPELVNLKQFLDEGDWQIDHIEIDDSLEFWIHRNWLYYFLRVLFTIPDKKILERSLYCEPPNRTQPLILLIRHTLDQKYSVSEFNLRLQSIQISAEQQGGFLNWVQLSENEVEFKLGLPIFNEEQNSINEDKEL